MKLVPLTFSFGKKVSTDNCWYLLRTSFGSVPRLVIANPMLFHFQVNIYLFYQVSCLFNGFLSHKEGDGVHCVNVPSFQSPQIHLLLMGDLQFYRIDAIALYYCLKLLFVAD